MFVGACACVRFDVHEREISKEWEFSLLSSGES